MNGFVPQIPSWFQTRKAAQITAFFAIRSGGKVNILKATKLIYLADRLSMHERDYSISGDSFVSMDFGPVNSYTYSYMRGQAPVRQEEWSEYLAVRQGNDIPLAQDLGVEDLDELSVSDIKILERIWHDFEEVDRFDLAEFAHEYCPEWTDPNGSSIPIDHSTIFQKLRKDDPAELAIDVQRDRAIVAALSDE